MPTKTGIPPCRLSVILAREAPVGVIFRRGPSKLAELIKWNTDTDTFERGQWFKGRINEYCSDLSPDGSLLIYWAEKSPIYHVLNEDWFTCWTAVSRPPWLTAIAFWPGKGSLAGGGLFLDDHTIWVSADSADLHSPKARKPNGLAIITEPALYIYPTRLERSGWQSATLVQSVESYKTDPWLKRKLRRYEKAEPRWQKTIVMHWNHTHRSPGHTYTLVDNQRGSEIPMDAASWADWDQRGRLVSLGMVRFSRESSTTRAG